MSGVWGGGVILIGRAAAARQHVRPEEKRTTTGLSRTSVKREEEGGQPKGKGSYGFEPDIRGEGRGREGRSSIFFLRWLRARSASRRLRITLGGLRDIFELSFGL